jgi:SAM-dependent methyltransferase
LPREAGLRRLLRVNLGLLLLGALVALAWVLATSASTSAEVLAAFRPAYALPLLGISALCVWLRFVRWQFLLRRVDVRVPTRESLSLYLASLVGIATPAHVGEVLRCVFLRRRRGVPLPRSLEVLVAERVLDVLALAVLGSAARPGEAGTFAVALAVMGLLVVLAVGVARAAGYPVQVFRALASPADAASAFGLSLAAWGAASTLVALAVTSIGGSLAVTDGVHVYAISTLLGAATLTPAGVGTTGSVAILELQELGVALDASVVAVSIMRLASTGFALAVGAVFLWLELRHGDAWQRGDAAAHFDAVGEAYSAQLAPHVWSRLLERKTDLLAAALPAGGARGVDLGCGLGAQARALRQRGYEVVGIDPSGGLLRAGGGGLPLVRASALALPLGDASIDFAYAVGVWHHLGGAEGQATAMREAARVLAPGGRLLIHETNPRNPLYRLYMGYVFPILKSIDEGVEHWVDPARWRAAEGFALRELRYFTFLPDFTPRWLLRWLAPLEARLEASALRGYSVHYFAVLEREPGPTVRGRES